MSFRAGNHFDFLAQSSIFRCSRALRPLRSNSPLRSMKRVAGEQANGDATRQSQNPAHPLELLIAGLQLLDNAEGSTVGL